jgi:hypothetical protein
MNAYFDHESSDGHPEDVRRPFQIETQRLRSCAPENEMPLGRRENW